LGERGFATTLVFNTWNTIERIPDGVKLLGYGVDFGYNDPSTVVGVYHDNDTLFFKELLYSRGLTTQDLITKMEQLSVDKTDSFWCDSSQPQTIEELKRSRFNVKPVNKKSILHGIDLIKRHKVFITTDSTNTLQEFQSYKWKINKDGQMLDTPEDKDNHSIDSIRYVLESTIGNKKPKFTII
jgi:phage terminase large subunit